MKQLAAHQKNIISMMDDMPFLGIFAEAGTGKTMIALSWLYDHFIDGSIENALVICPASLIPSWRRAIRRMVEFGYSELDIEMMNLNVTIISYQRLWKSNGTYRGYKQYKIRDEIDRQWDVVFCDESHRLGDPKSVQTKQALKLASQCSRRYILTGTPDSNNYVKLYGQLKFLDPSLWENYREFDRKYVISHNYFKKPILFDVERLETLKKSYGTVVRLRDCFDMPSENEVDFPVELTETRVYRDFINNNVSEYGFDVTTAGIGSQKALQVCSGFYLDADGLQHRLSTQKLDALMEIIDGSESKIAIYCRFIASMDMIAERLNKHNIAYHRFDGSTKESVWESFQSDDVKVILVQYQRGSEGIDLFAASRMVFFEPTQSALQLEQAKARIMRKGQLHPCVYYHMFCEGTVEEKTMNSVRNGVDVSRAMLDNWSQEERNRTQNAKTH